MNSSKNRYKVIFSLLKTGQTRKVFKKQSKKKKDDKELSARLVQHLKPKKHFFKKAQTSFAFGKLKTQLL